MIYMVFNESGKTKVHTRLSFRQQVPTYVYDVLNQKLTRLSQEPDGSVTLILEPQESLVLLAGYEPDTEDVMELAAQEGIRTPYEGIYRISLASYQDLNTFGEADVTDTLYDITRKNPGFAGIVRYELNFDKNDYHYVLLEQTGEGVEAYLNGRSLGKRITAPYLYELGEQQESNKLVLELATTLVNAVPDGLSCENAIPATGIGRVMFVK